MASGSYASVANTYPIQWPVQPNSNHDVSLRMASTTPTLSEMHNRAYVREMSPATDDNAPRLPPSDLANVRTISENSSKVAVSDLPHTQLLTPHSPTTNSYSSYRHLAMESPAPKSCVRPRHWRKYTYLSSRGMIGAIDSTLSPHSSEPRMTGYSASQLTPSSSPVYAQYNGRRHVIENPMSEDSPSHSPLTIGDRDSPVTSLDTRCANISQDTAGSEVAPVPTTVSSPRGHSDTPTPLLPAFEESHDRSRTPRRNTPLGSARASQKASRGISPAASEVQDVVDDVFRLRPPSRLSQVASLPLPLGGRSKQPPGQASHNKRPRLGDARTEDSTLNEENPQSPFEYIRSANSKTGFLVDCEKQPDAQSSDGQHVVIFETPVRGRRLKFVRPTSPVETGTSPQLKNSPPTAAMSNLTLQWLQSPPPAPEEHPKPVDPEERESKRQRRLAAFIHSQEPHISPLKPVEVAGIGRVAVHPDDITETYIMSPVKRSSKFTKRKGSRKHAASVSSTPAKRVTVYGKEVLQGVVPYVPGRRRDLTLRDNTSAGGRTQDAESEASRMRHLELFFDRDTDEDSDTTSAPELSLPLTLGVGLPVNGNFDHLSKATLNSGDARLAITSVIHRMKSPAKQKPVPSTEPRLPQTPVGRATRRVFDSEDEDDQNTRIDCVCGTENDLPMVQCDSCNGWSHQECVKWDETDPDANWHCFKCQLRPPQIPTFAMPSDSPNPAPDLSVKIFNSPSLEASPYPHAEASHSSDLVPTTPTGRAAGEDDGFDHRTSHDSYLACRQVRYHDTPNTRRSEDHRTYHSPAFTDFFNIRSSKPQDAFDMTATPSRTVLGTPFRSSRGTRPSTHSIFDTPRTPLDPGRAFADSQFGHDNRIPGPSSATPTKLPLFLYAAPPASDTRDQFRHSSPLASSALSGRRRLDPFEPLHIETSDNSDRQYGSISSVRSERNELSSTPFPVDSQDCPVATGLQESALRTSNGSD
ncbi:uncharacterized protein EI90DRAFT_2558665 [Cantharellus anzutake]|uniref:uncharacterized protein n=1 Tax=Cantharellus anzutake TaxID=1750568 RepID=UPI001907841E|nr:uncharacterized protein EI90DRAFT_2558665 [Cantharellus anzutake]KAF8338182.1 hypothetical protein EI90DRAFT_2558665 [Cantharellus anzutake]